MTDEEYMTKFMDLLRYVPYLKNEKAKVHRFFCRFPLAFKYLIECDEPGSLEEVIGKLKHYYEQLNHKIESQQHWKGKEKTKGK